MTTPTPDQGASHWTDRFVGVPLAGEHLSDAEIATRVRMLVRHDMDHEAVCLMARDRIAKLSRALRDATAAESEARAAAIAIAHAVRVRAAENETVKPQGVKSLSDLQYLAGFLAGKRHAAAEIERELRAALDAASPLTTPTPGQGALERASPDFVEPPMRSIARKVLARVEAAQAPGDDSDRQEAWSIIEDALTAAASKARAAERERCEQIVQNYIDRPTSGPKNNTLSAFEQGMDHIAGCIDNASAILDAIRALATPAQSPSP